MRERLTSKFPSRLRSRFHPANALMPRAEAASRILNRAPSTSNQTPRIQVRQGPINCLFEHVGSISPREIFSRICGAPLNCLIVAFFDAESPLNPKAMSSPKHHNTATQRRSKATSQQRRTKQHPLQLRQLDKVEHFLAISHIQLAINAPRIGLHRALRQHKLLLDIRARAALSKKHRHFRFPRRHGRRHEGQRQGAGARRQ